MYQLRLHNIIGKITLPRYAKYGSEWTKIIFFNPHHNWHSFYSVVHIIEMMYILFLESLSLPIPDLPKQLLLHYTSTDSNLLNLLMDSEKLNNMIPETISLVDRQLLINQCKILSFFGDAQDKALYERRIEILEKGYTGLYQKVFNTLYEEVPISTYQEVENILKMYSRINDSIRNLTDEDKKLLDLGSLEFEGFDASNGMHYYMMSYLVDRMDEYHEYKGRELKSHTTSPLSKYNKMLPIHAEFELLKKERYTTSDLQKFIEAVTVKVS